MTYGTGEGDCRGGGTNELTNEIVCRKAAYAASLTGM